MFTGLGTLQLPQWFKPWIAALTTIAFLILVGVIYAWTLVFFWPIIGIIGAIGLYQSGGWNHGDPDSSQAFLAAMCIALPFFAIYMWLETLREANSSQAVT